MSEPFSVRQVSTKLYRGPRPTTVADFTQLETLGITRIICLQGSWIEFFEGDVAKEIAMWERRFCWNPLSWFFPPSRNKISAILSIIRNPAGRVFIHCKEGKDRTGFVVAAYQLSSDWGCTYRFAVTQMFRQGFHWRYFYWLPFLRFWSRRND